MSDFKSKMHQIQFRGSSCNGIWPYTDTKLSSDSVPRLHTHLREQSAFLILRFAGTLNRTATVIGTLAVDGWAVKLVEHEGVWMGCGPAQFTHHHHHHHSGFLVRLLQPRP